MRRLFTALLCAVVVSACSGPGQVPSPTGGTVADVFVEQSETRAPEITVDRSRDWGTPGVRVEWAGEGERLGEGDRLLLDIYSESLKDAEVVKNTFDGSPMPIVFDRALLGDELYAALEGQRVGARLVQVLQATDETDGEPLVAVIDILPAAANGEVKEAPDGFPTVSEDENGDLVVSIGGLVAPPDLRARTLIQGSGLQVVEGSVVTANYIAVTWETGEVYDSSWAIDRAPLVAKIGAGELVSGLDTALIDQVEGSRLIVIVPPSLGFPSQGTMVFVVDVLDVWNPDE